MLLPSSGGILLAQILKNGKIPTQFFKSSTNHGRGRKAAYADRVQYMGDPDFIQNKTSYLTPDGY